LEGRAGGVEGGEVGGHLLFGEREISDEEAWLNGSPASAAGTVSRLPATSTRTVRVPLGTPQPASTVTVSIAGRPRSSKLTRVAEAGAVGGWPAGWWTLR
jgi:hypothetical protein